MLEYFKVYSWNLALSMALDAGANMGEVDRACRGLRHVDDDQKHANDFFQAWADGGARLARAAEKDERAGNLLSAGEKYRRACVMYITGERIPAHDYPPRLAAYDELLRTFGKYVECAGVTCVRVEIPFEGSFLPALMVSAGSNESPAPCIVHFNGLDGVKEYLYLCGLPAMLAQRGVSILLVDNPGVGEALRKNNLYNGPEAELPAGACVDYLESRPDVDKERIGMMALSLGGYHAPRAAAFEPRFSCCVAWGANYDWGKRFRARIEGSYSAQKSVPHYFDHVKWVLGQQSIEDCLAITDRYTLEGVLERVRVPVYITHGADDRQIPVADAIRTFDECVNAPERELRIFSAEEGGEQHCSIGNMSLATNAMADWIAGVLK
ncbi:alpha/beta hydrolase family protein [Achromobacter insolitus]|uniref:2,6-dihydropseudooxynicotine hydrolase n=1 Tax=Achromobacter insolitus TaxID=217204 RepID=A0A6S7EV59_9BURK|nr:prolyl oligopeptidase family serine peptidase [Achromobacter insolitus]MDQ6211922.1 prolyl oligopeptidase family serine peptidase [Achromobacter insolitus]CAB3929195.1 2,6-dihydropseudooxynicotine hydrolase [Achromobacter insolitus]CAB3944153.1 2,6-dihydropseudooxynicotine hydrolase [Achromobacter insolitus]